MYRLGGTIQLFPLKSLSAIPHLQKIYLSGTFGRNRKRCDASPESSLGTPNRQDAASPLSPIYDGDVAHLQSVWVSFRGAHNEGPCPGRAITEKQRFFAPIAKFYKGCVSSVKANLAPWMSTGSLREKSQDERHHCLSSAQSHNDGRRPSLCAMRRRHGRPRSVDRVDRVDAALAQT